MLTDFVLSPLPPHASPSPSPVGTLEVDFFMSVEQPTINKCDDYYYYYYYCRAKIGDEFTLFLAKNSQLAMSLHFPLPKIRTFRFSLHTSRLSLHGEVTMVALKFAMSSHFPLPKMFSPSGFVPPFSNEPRDEWPKTQDKWSNLAQSYFCSSHRKTESN